MGQITKSVEKKINTKIVRDTLFGNPKLVLGIDEAQSQKLFTIESYDLSQITNKFSAKYDNLRLMPEQVYMTKALLGFEITPEIAKTIESDFKKWFALSVLYPGTSFAPISREVDMYWHLFILHTKEYNEFCKLILGKYFGHQPTNEKIKDSVNAAGENTRALFYSIFGISGVEKLKDKEILHLARNGKTIEACDGNPPCSGDGCTGNEPCNQGSCKSACSS